MKFSEALAWAERKAGITDLDRFRTFSVSLTPHLDLWSFVKPRDHWGKKLKSTSHGQRLAMYCTKVENGQPLFED